MEATTRKKPSRAENDARLLEACEGLAREGLPITYEAMGRLAGEEYRTLACRVDRLRKEGRFPHRIERRPKGHGESSQAKIAAIINAMADRGEVVTYPRLVAATGWEQRKVWSAAKNARDRGRLRADVLPLPKDPRRKPKPPSKAAVVVANAEVDEMILDVAQQYAHLGMPLATLTLADEIGESYNRTSHRVAALRKKGGWLWRAVGTNIIGALREAPVATIDDPPDEAAILAAKDAALASAAAEKLRAQKERCQHFAERGCLAAEKAPPVPPSGLREMVRDDRKRRERWRSLAGLPAEAFATKVDHSPAYVRNTEPFIRMMRKVIQKHFDEDRRTQGAAT